jgi:Trk K+ transport system NAD-binding subunit
VAGGRRFLLDLLPRLAPFLALFGGVYLVASLGFFVLEGGRVDFLDSFYWGAVTLSTVGYGDLVPTNETARLFTIGVLFTQIFLGGYLFSVIVGVVSEESQKRLLGTLGTDLKDHTVVLGYGPIGQACVRELLLADQQIAVVAEHPEEVANIRSLNNGHGPYATYGPPADPEILKRANIETAHSVVVCTEDDTTTLIAALNVRSLSSTIRIVVSVNRPELKTTLRTAGVTYVASPGDMGGRLCASAAFQPEVANAIEDISEEGDGADIREYMLTTRTPISAQSVPEAEQLVRRASGCLLIGIARRKGEGEFETILNPPDSMRFRPGDGILVLGTNENHLRFHKWIGVPQGR